MQLLFELIKWPFSGLQVAILFHTSSTRQCEKHDLPITSHEQLFVKCLILLGPVFFSKVEVGASRVASDFNCPKKIDTP